MLREMRRLVVSRIIVVVVGALATAVMCANADPRMLAGMHDFKVLPTSSIVDSPDTVGLADSNLTRLTSVADIDQELEMMQSIGVTDVRIGLFWSQIEPVEGVFNWTTADEVINEANKLGMNVLAVLNQTPAWAGTPINAGTPSTTDYAAYAQAVAERYGNKISAIEVWNEPNSSTFLDPLSPANYTGLLKAAYTAIKAVDPSITVIGGVLGAGLSVGNVTMNPVDFLQGMYAAGAQGYFDALSFHPYDSSEEFSAQEGQANTPLSQLQAMRALMVQMGDGAKQIWATEYGLATGTTGDMVSQQQQANFIADFLNSWGEQAGTGPIFIYTTRDLDTGSTDDQDNFGIWETDWTPKLAVQVIEDFIAAQLTPSPSNPIIAAIKSFIVNTANFVGSLVTGAVDAVVSVVKTVAAGVVWLVTQAAKAVVNVVTGIGNLIKNALNAVVNGITHIFGSAAATSATTTTAAVPAIQRNTRKAVAAVASTPAVTENTPPKRLKGTKVAGDSDGTATVPDAARKRSSSKALSAATAASAALTHSGKTSKSAKRQPKTHGDN